MAELHKCINCAYWEPALSCFGEPTGQGGCRFSVARNRKAYILRECDRYKEVTTMVTKEKQTEKALVPKQEKAVVTWQDRNITITFDDVKNRICQKASDQEVIVFLKMAQSLNLNPWAREIYLVKYKDDEPASYIIASEAYLKAGELCPEYDGHEAGIVLRNAVGQLEERNGTLLMEDERTKLVGGWARVYRKDRQRPFYIAVNFKECAKYTKDGKLTRFWAIMPATMIRKVALARALREAFPSRLGHMVADAEYREMPDDTLPPALEKNGKPDWKKFYAKIRSELGLTPEQTHELVNAESFKDLLNEGWTMEAVWDALITALQRQKAGEPEQIVDAETGEIVTQEEDIFGEGEEESDTAAQPESETEQPTDISAPEKPKRDPESVKTISELLRACHEDFKIQPNDVCRELGYSSTQDISEKPSECFRKIAAARG